MSELIHGRASTYNNHRFRCDPCKKGWAEYQRPRVAAWRAKKKREGK